MRRRAGGGETPKVKIVSDTGKGTHRSPPMTESEEGGEVGGGGGGGGVRGREGGHVRDGKGAAGRQAR